MLPARAPRPGRHRASAGTRLGPRPPRPPPSPASDRRPGSEAGAAARRRRRRPGSMLAPSGGLLLLDRVDGTKADLNPVPGVDLHDQQGELYLLILREVPAQCLVGIVRRMGLGHQRESLGPAERGPLAVGIKPGLAPRAKKMQSLLGLAVLAGIYCVMVDAEGAPVDL